MAYHLTNTSHLREVERKRCQVYEIFECRDVSHNSPILKASKGHYKRFDIKISFIAKRGNGKILYKFTGVWSRTVKKKTMYER